MRELQLAGLTQLVECQLPKLDVAGSNPVSRSESRAPSRERTHALAASPRDMTHCALIVPCFNEETRLDRDSFLGLAQATDLELLFVDDGSRDGTVRALEDFREKAPDRIFVLPLEKNGGKGEAVRRGMLEGLARGASVVGFADADLATPPSELVRLRDKLLASDLSVVVGSRVLLMGTDIQRRLARHLLGRAFATVASNILEMPFYDTQCGAKYFRDTPALRAALARPFLSRWAFDIELLGRIHIGERDVAGVPKEQFREVPLERWVDVADSKIGVSGMARTLFELPAIDRELKRLRKARLASQTSLG
jgi:dolichyl-phosphate beta-glucosyltransferase